MKRIAIRSIIIFLIIAGVTATLTLTHKSQPTKQTAKSVPITSKLPKEARELSKAQKEEPRQIFGKSVILINQSSAAPAVVSVPRGFLVEWLNMESTQHQIVSDDGKTIPTAASPVLRQGQKFDFKFTVRGTFSYHDNLHPTIEGTVKVEE